MISMSGSPSGTLACALVLWALGLYLLYWVIRLAVRHAMNDVGVRRLVLKSYEDEAPPAPDPGPDDTPA